MNLQLVLTGTRPLIIQSDRLVDPFDVITKEIRSLTSKKRDKSEDDLRRIAELEFKGSLYYDKALGPYLPSQNLLASLKGGAQKNRNGKKLLEAVTIMTYQMPILYDGPRELDALYACEEFQFRRSVVVNRNRTMRMRPIFLEWALKAELILEEQILDLDQLRAAALTAGERISLGTYRPHYGRYRAVITVQ